MYKLLFKDKLTVASLCAPGLLLLHNTSSCKYVICFHKVIKSCNENEQNTELFATSILQLLHL